MHSTLFDIEQNIINCWQVVEDIENLRQVTDRREMSPDEVDNYLLGLHTIYQTKFEKLFALYENYIVEQANKKNLP